MGARGRNGRSVLDIITNGYRRTIHEMGGGDSLGVTLPKDVLRERGVDQSDEIAIEEVEGGLFIHLPDEDADEPAEWPPES